MEAACASIALGDIGRKKKGKKKEKRGGREKKKKSRHSHKQLGGKKRTSWLSEHGATKPLKNG